MNLLFRCFTTYVRSIFRSELGLFDENQLPLRVWPDDLDTYLHLDNGRHLSLGGSGELGREVEPVRMPQWVTNWHEADLEMKNRARSRSSRHELSPED